MFFCGQFGDSFQLIMSIGKYRSRVYQKQECRLQYLEIKWGTIYADGDGSSVRPAFSAGSLGEIPSEVIDALPSGMERLASYSREDLNSHGGWNSPPISGGGESHTSDDYISYEDERHCLVELV